MIKKGLGKGLGALIESEETGSQGVHEIRINDIESNLSQPRKKFDDEKIRQLADSIRQHGVVQPIILTKEEDRYRIVAGERRWRAARIAGLTKIPAIIRDLSSRQKMEIALIENLQREDLNPIEEAEAYEKLIREYGMTQEEVAGVVGRSRPAIANSMRLLELGDVLKRKVIDEEITSGHARALLSAGTEEMRNRLAEEVVRRKLTVRETEQLVKKEMTVRQPKKAPAHAEEYVAVEDRLKSLFGTRVSLSHKRKKGKIIIEYYSDEELDRLLELFNRLQS